MHSMTCSVCKREVASGPNEAGVRAAYDAHMLKAHPKPVEKPKAVKK